MPQRLIDRLVDKLHNHLAQSSDLPSISRLSAQWGVSYPTMARAVRVLVDQGKIECHPGRAIRVVGASAHDHAPQVNGGSRKGALYLELREQIMDGTLRAGNPLPKLQSYLLSTHASKHTIIDILRMLEKEGLVHKGGKRWMAGPAPAPSPPGSSTHIAPATLILAPYMGSFRNLFSDEFNGRFMAPFADELARSGVRQHFVQMYTGDVEPHNKRRALRDADALVRKLGEQYLGALIHRGPFRFDEHHENMDAWVRFLHESGKPIVFFDSSGMGEPFSRERYPKARNYYRMYFDETAAVRKALEALARAGHRSIGFLLPSQEPSPWIAQRAGIVESIARQQFPDVKILTIIQDEPIWHVSQKDSDDSMYERVMGMARQWGKDAARCKSPQRALIENTPSFKRLLAAQVTAMISPNDDFAKAHYLWLMEAGIEIPRHLSMISFDNNADTAAYPISSVDFGFSRLGNLAAHIFLGHMPLRMAREGSIPGECMLMDRGSVGAPRERPLRI
jgi:DNA-binding LacI/PurR family transcriptional regulator/DNA-binding transcriptional regulator YhcF (GntR family)